MTREVSSFYFLREAESLFSMGRPAEGLWKLKKASTTGYNDTSIHSEIGLFLSDRGFFQAARSELEKALIYHDDLSGIYNNWGYYFDRRGDYEKAIDSFEKAIALKPGNYTYHNNLGLAFHKAGKERAGTREF
jgi:Flp pilus assembly protein TadD